MTLTRICIVLESVSHGLFENSHGISRKARNFKRFFRPKSGGLQKKRSSPILRLIFRPKSGIRTFFPAKIRWSPKTKKKEVFTDFETDFSAEIGNSNVFSAQNQVVSSPILRLIFRPKSGIRTFFPPKTRWSPKKKGSSPILRLIFWPKLEI